ncbi:MAG: DUF3368 domain-containing protein [Cyanobacteriota bacterium]|nr:DUF3368 domain-containing protein [Cyanobacteriota bacterium]
MLGFADSTQPTLELISTIQPIMDDLIVQARFRISSQLYAEVLRLAGE